jgi:hypothetical protein
MPYFFVVRNVNMSNSPEQPRFDSISHFLASGGFDYRVFDMGRKVTLFSHDDFNLIESQQQLYPYPFQKKASLALLFWSKKKNNENNTNKEAVIWFLQFPIDEMGYLQLESRDGFLLSLLEQAGKNIESKLKGAISTDEMTESPFAFKPAEDRLAMFHAFATRELDQQPSHYYQATREYLKGTLGYEQWQFLGLQGIADVVARLDEDGNESLLNKALPKLPEVPLESFCLMLENTQPNEALAYSLIELIKKQLISDKPNISITAALLRGVSGATINAERENLLLSFLDPVKLNKLAKEIEVLVSISGRCWLDLENNEVLKVFLASLALQEQLAFNAVLSDLMMLPNMKRKVLEVVRDVTCSKVLDEKMTAFYAQL